MRVLALIALLMARPAMAGYRAEVDIYLPTDEVKHFVYPDDGDAIKVVQGSGIIGYVCMRNFETGDGIRKFRIGCRELTTPGNKHPTLFNIIGVCGNGFMPATLHFTKNGERDLYRILAHCEGSAE